MQYREPEGSTVRGELLTQKNPLRTPGRTVELPFTIFVDDTAFIFDNREELASNLPFLQRQFARFGLLMHVGTINQDESDPTKRLEPSKTECMFFPARPSNLSKNDLVPERIFFDENKQFHVHYTDEFKYLGSRLIPTLSDEQEILHRIRQASNQVRSLSNFWNSAADLRTKRMIYQAIPLNTAIFGCEYWALTEKSRTRLSAFHHTSLRKILGIKHKHVQDQHIRNAYVRNKLCIDDILDTIIDRQANFIGKVARMPMHRLPRQVLGAWIRAPRKTGGVEASLARTVHSTLTTILQIDDTQLTTSERNNWNRHGCLHMWIPLASDRANWKRTTTRYMSLQRRRTWHQGTGTLGEPVLTDWIKPERRDTLHEVLPANGFTSSNLLRRLQRAPVDLGDIGF